MATIDVRSSWSMIESGASGQAIAARITSRAIGAFEDGGAT